MTGRNWLLNTLLALVLVPTITLADQYHNVNQIVGHRALGLAGAYTAISDDPSGLAYNPAGIVYSPTNNVSASVNTFQFLNISYDNALGGTNDWERNSIQLLPNFFGVIQPMGRFKIGFSSSVPDSVKENQDQQFDNISAFVDKFLINLNKTDNTYHVGPSIGLALSPTLSVGANLHYHFRSEESNIGQYIVKSDGTREIISNYFETQEHGIRPKIGVMWSPANKVSVGLTIDRIFVLSSVTELQRAICVTSLTAHCVPGSLDDPQIETSSATRPYPWQIRGGLAWFPSNSLLVSGDLIVHTAPGPFMGNTQKVATVDIAVGTEWYWSPRYALRTGVYSSQANTPDVIPSADGMDPNIDTWGATMSVSRFNKGSDVTIGGQYTAGTGLSDLFGDDRAPQSTHISGFAFYISTSYSY